MDRTLFDKAIIEARRFHEACPALQAFHSFPADDALTFHKMKPLRPPAVDYFVADKTIEGGPFDDARRAFLALESHLSWREPYKGQALGDGFLDRFCTFELLGLEGHFLNTETRGFVLYSAGDIYYPWHHHPAEEIYFILAGEAGFATEGNPARHVKAGDSIFHAENEPHNMQTGKSGILAWVQWRGDLTTPPAFTDRLNG